MSHGGKTDLEEFTSTTLLLPRLPFPLYRSLSSRARSEALGIRSALANFLDECKSESLNVFNDRARFLFFLFYLFIFFFNEKISSHRDRAYAINSSCALALELIGP